MSEAELRHAAIGRGIERGSGDLPYGSYQLAGGPTSNGGHWYDGIVSAWNGAMNWLGDLTGVGDGQIGLNARNSAAFDAGVDEIVVTAQRTGRNISTGWNDFFNAWSVEPSRQRIGDTSASVYRPPSNPIAMFNADIGFRNGLARDMFAHADGVNGMRSVFNSGATNAGLSTRSYLEGVHARWASLWATPYGAIDTIVGRPAGAAGIRWQSSQNLTGTMIAEPTIGVASIFVGNPEALAATIGPRAIIQAPSAAELTLALERFKNQSIAMLAENPALAREYLDLKSYQSLVNRTPTARLNYGNAVERLTADIIANDAEWSQYLTYQNQAARPGLSAPDFIGFDGRDMHVFDITTHRQIAAHGKRWYGSYANYVTYDGLPPDLVFPR